MILLRTCVVLLAFALGAGQSFAQLTSGAVPYWKLDEASGSRADSAGSNTLSDSTSTGSAVGKVGNAADFESGSNNFLSITDNATLSMGDVFMSGSAWVKLESKATAMMVASHYNATGNQRGWRIEYFNTSDRLRFLVSANGTDLVAANANNFGSPPTDTWIFIYWWHDPDTNEIGIRINNGTADTASHSGGIFDSNQPFQLGRQGTASIDDWDGLIDEVGIWKGRNLTTDEQAALYNAGAGRTWPFASGLYRHLLDTNYQ